MAIGSGKYDDECTYVRERTQAKGTIVIVVDGNKGSGFACQADLLTTVALPIMLENIAREIRESGLAP